jgi:nucleoside-diphosphate-sugar epimerase
VRPDVNPVPLDHPRRYANSSYAISKGAAEDYLCLSANDHVVLRLANVVGDRCVSGPLPVFYERLRAGKTCFVTPARRDFVFVKDLVKIVLLAVDGVGSGAYHFSSGGDVAISELYESVARAVGLDETPEPQLRPLSEDDAPSILLDPSRTWEDFGSFDFTTLDEIVKAATDYYDRFGVGGGYTHLKAE